MFELMSVKFFAWLLIGLSLFLNCQSSLHNLNTRFLHKWLVNFFDSITIFSLKLCPLKHSFFFVNSNEFFCFLFFHLCFCYHFQEIISLENVSSQIFTLISFKSFTILTLTFRLIVLKIFAYLFLQKVGQKRGREKQRGETGSHLPAHCLHGLARLKAGAGIYPGLPQKWQEPQCLDHLLLVVGNWILSGTVDLDLV